MRLGSRRVLACSFVAVAAVALILGTAVGVLTTPGGAQADEPETVPTPAATVVSPVVATVVPVENVVTPITGMAEARIGSAQQAGEAAGGSDNLFTGVRGGLIGAGIAVGAVLVVTAAIRGARAALRRNSNSAWRR